MSDVLDKRKQVAQRIAKLTALLRVPLEAYGPWDSNVLADDHPVQITVTLGWIRKVRAAVQK